MKTLVINTVWALTPPKRRELAGIIGDFEERRPEIDGRSLWTHARRLINLLDQQEQIEQMDKIMQRCPISNVQWQQPVLVLLCVPNTAGMELAADLLCQAVARRKGDDVQYMIFGAGLGEQSSQPRLEKLKSDN